MTEKIAGKLFADKYRVDSILRSSELGNFYRARHAFTERPVILQIMRAELANDAAAAERFSELAKSISQISHPDVLSVTDFGRTASGQPYATLENVEGETLREALVRDGQVPYTVAFDVSRSAASGLAAAHEAGLIHGNLNTGNILVVYDADGSKTVKLFDFGSANPIANGANGEIIARDFAYVAPELCSGAEKPDALSDVYSLGVVLYEMLAGDVPFTGSTAAEVINRQTEDPPPPLSSFRTDLSANVEPIVLKALAKNPEMRYQSAGEFADAIELYAAGPGDAAASDAGNGNNMWKRHLSFSRESRCFPRF
ncbi:MAG TPA: serine/threonine-protein kinase [Pyrinomonadaceae bacterium]|nr:serine/threonine-protein kinase [Pyrinomonadaceae bacterium]